MQLMPRASALALAALATATLLSACQKKVDDTAGTAAAPAAASNASAIAPAATEDNHGPGLTGTSSPPSPPSTGS